MISTLRIHQLISTGLRKGTLYIIPKYHLHKLVNINKRHLFQIILIVIIFGEFK